VTLYLNLYEIIGNRIREFREKKQWTQAELSERLQITRSSITNIESGRQKIQLDTLYQIALALNVEIELFLPTLNDLYNNKNNDYSFKFLEDKTELDNEEFEWLKKVILKGKNIE
jgi:transcriptional regulator with XRE-family HTH domain